MTKIILRQKNDGIIEEASCSKEYLEKEDPVIHYLPHHMIKSEMSFE